jgi:protocatechuate 3,4-dioxygenase beta subunit
MPSPYVYESWTETRTDERGYYRLLVQPDPYVLVFGDASAEIAWIPRAPDESIRAAGDTSTQRPKIVIDPNVGKRLDVQLEAGVDVRIRFVNGLTGKPVPDVVVTPRDYSGLEQKADSTGRAAVPNLPATNVKFSFDAEGFLRGSSETALLSKRTNQNGPPKFALRHGASFSLNREMPEMVITLEPAVEVSGWVLDPGGNGVPMAIVSVVPPSDDATDVDAASLSSRTHTRKDGYFSLWVPPFDDRPFHLLAHDRGWMKFGPATEPNIEPGRLWANAIGPKLQATAGQKLENIELRLVQPGQIQGRVVDEEGRPLADVAIFSGSADSSEGTVDLPREVSDREGRFVLTGVRPGQQQLHSSPPSQRRTSKRQAHQVVEVIAGKTTNAGDIVIPSRAVPR